jgi:ribosomal protein L10
MAGASMVLEQFSTPGKILSEIPAGVEGVVPARVVGYGTARALAAPGPDGVILGYEDVVTTTKVLTDFAKEHDDRPAFKLGVLENQILDQAQLDRLAKLPPREQLLAELAGAFEAPMAALAGALEAKTQEMVGLLDAYKAQKQEAGE